MEHNGFQQELFHATGVREFRADGVKRERRIRVDLHGKTKLVVAQRQAELAAGLRSRAAASQAALAIFSPRWADRWANYFKRAMSTAAKSRIESRPARLP